MANPRAFSRRKAARHGSRQGMAPTREPVTVIISYIENVARSEMKVVFLAVEASAYDDFSTVDT